GLRDNSTRPPSPFVHQARHALSREVPMSTLLESVAGANPITHGSANGSPASSHDANAGEMSALLNALIALKKGKSGVRLPADWTGVAGKVADAFNEVVELNERMAEELARLSRVVGKEGRLRQRLSLGDVRGFWRESVGSVNDLIDDLVHPTIETARVIGAVAQGDLSKTMALETENRPLQGEFLRTAQTINT